MKGSSDAMGFAVSAEDSAEEDAAGPCDDSVDLGALFDAHAAYVAGVAIRILGRDAEVDDVVQEVFIAAIRGLKGLHNAEAVRSWLATVTVRASVRVLRRRRLRWFLFPSVRRGDREFREPVVDAPQEARALVRQLYASLDQISVALRVAWQLRYIEGYSLSEVAQHTGCSLATAKRRISVAQDQLSRLLDVEGREP